MMIARTAAPALATGIALFLVACGQFVRVPPGQSVRLAMAQRPEVVAYPTPAPDPGGYTGEFSRADFAGSPPPMVPETVADYFMLGTAALQEGRNEEAIRAFEKAVAIDPEFPEGWSHLAICYQNSGQIDRATEAFKRYKTIAAQ